jgi:aryl-alcohol dehydrogenase-like predicted oxidoreductase
VTVTGLARRPLGAAGETISAIGLGAMTLTQVAGATDADQRRRVVHTALEMGVTYFDTADVYGPAGGGDGVNELALMEALRAWSGSLDDVIVGTKGGHLRFPETDTWWVDGSPRHLRQACIASIRRLGLDPLPLYQHHRPDPQLPYEESIGALRDLYDEGMIRRVGISNANVEQIRSAHSILGPALVSVQNEFSPSVRSAAAGVAECEALGLTFMSWGPFGGMRQAKSLGEGGSAFAAVAQRHGATPHQIALAWQLHLSPVIVPIPGASRPESVRDSAAAAAIRLTDDDMAELDR